MKKLLIYALIAFVIYKLIKGMKSVGTGLDSSNSNPPRKVAMDAGEVTMSFNERKVNSDKSTLASFQMDKHVVMPANKIAMIANLSTKKINRSL